MSENMNSAEEPAEGAQVYPVPETSSQAGADDYPVLESPAGSLGAGESPQTEAGEIPAEGVHGSTEPTAIESRPPQPSAQPLSASDERTWAMLAHLSVLLNLVTGVLGPFVALIIYLVYRDRSRYVAYQSMQAFIFQLITWVGSGILIGGMWLVVGLLSAVLVGILLIPFALIGTICLGILPLVGLIYGIVGAVETSQGKDFQYWLVGDWARGLL